MEQRSASHVALGRAIREARDARGISQEDLASASGLHRTYVGGIERGERNPAYANLLRIARALGLRASALLSRAEELERGA
ncbi:MAG TPA: helix-turn-helix transcriptional regulator [Solirubrobacteraceae bacterium]|jgi:transcriptional regulator with XRE-family HTH domain|nr:helix-turn-helix transcriptional regulator [Solirubrobacteraceae bacterium]